MRVDLSTRLGRLRLPNPVLTASGCAGSGRELQAFLDLAEVGAFTTASVTLEPRRGRRTPRVAEAPDVTSIVDVAEAVVRADGLTLVSALPGMAVDPATLRPALGGVTGGLSGPAIRPVAVRAVYQVHAVMPDLPIIGTGGVRTGWDALELVLAGASAIAVGSALLRDPGAAGRIVTELSDELAQRGLASPADAVGLAHQTASTPMPPAESEPAQ